VRDENEADPSIAQNRRDLRMTPIQAFQQPVRAFAKNMILTQTRTVMASEVEPPVVPTTEKQRVAPLRFATVAMTFLGKFWGNLDTPTWKPH
jgi:hypothetical protein